MRMNIDGRGATGRYACCETDRSRRATSGARAGGACRMGVSSAGMREDVDDDDEPWNMMGTTMRRRTNTNARRRTVPMTARRVLMMLR
eukprot:3511073-Pyramimonas_sp.AAC.1